MDRLDTTGELDVSVPSGPLELTPDRLMHCLEEIRLAALAAGAFAPAIRCVELQGKHIGLWAGETTPTISLADLVIQSYIDNKKVSAGES
jgi:hypothetical protein